MLMKRIGLASAVVLVAMAGLATTASAHARYKNSTPGTAEVVQTSPAKLDLYFTQDIQKVSGAYEIQVERDRGASVTAAPAVIDDGDRSHLTVALKPNLGAGRYVVSWKNVSDDDGDPAEGAFSFYVQTAPNSVDLVNDKQLEQIGAEPDETPGADQSPSASASASTATPAASASARTATAGVASPVATAVAASTSSGDSNTGRNVAIIVASIVAIIVIGGGVAFAVRSRMRP